MTARPDEDTASRRIVLVGSARLPESIRGGTELMLLVELALDGRSGCVTDVSTSLALPNYNALLRGIIVVRSLEEFAAVPTVLVEQLRGPLVRATIAALANALSHSVDRSDE